MKKVLITGITGFVGQYLCEYLLSSNNYQILGTSHSQKSIEKIKKLKDKIIVKQIEMTDPDAFMDLISDFLPDDIYHLAAHTSPLESFQNPAHLLSNNIVGQVNILEAVRKNKKKDIRVLIISSGEVYGKVPVGDLPVNENTALRPTSPYAVSKIAQDYLGLQYFLSYGMHTIRVRPFNHIGPGQATKLVVPSFAYQIAEIEKKKTEPVMLVGNLDAERDFTDVRDIVRAYVMLMEKGKPGDVYNVGSGVSIKINEILKMLLSFSQVKVTIQTDPDRLRPSDIPQIRVDHTKLSSLTGWQPEIPIEKTLRDILDYWRTIV